MSAAASPEPSIAAAISPYQHNVKLTQLSFYLNGKSVTLRQCDPERVLLDYIRDNARLTGTKLGCGEGGCGACTVLISYWDHHEKRSVHQAVNACLVPLCSVADCHVITIEGLGSPEALHPIQKRFADYFSSQCGFCTPGFIVSLHAALRNNPQGLTEAEIEQTFDGNLCRCTGYRPILDAAKTFAKDHKFNSANPPMCAMGAECCKNKKSSNDCGPPENHSETMKVLQEYESKMSTLIFPSALKNAKPASLRISGPNCTWYRPVELVELLQLKNSIPEAKLVGGNTELALDTRFRGVKFPVQISTLAVSELQGLQRTDKEFIIGSGVTLTRLKQQAMQWLEQSKSLEESSLLKAILQQLKWFAGNQIRNVGTLAGNVCTGSPISDLNPVWQAANAVIECVSLESSTSKLVHRDVSAADWFIGYKQCDIKPSELFFQLRVPIPSENEFLAAYKQARRIDDDMAIITGCLRVKLSSSALTDNRILSAGFSFGGMSYRTVMTPKTTDFAAGKLWNTELLEILYTELCNELILPLDVPAGMRHYRTSLCCSFLLKFFYFTKQQLLLKNNSTEKLDEETLKLLELDNPLAPHHTTNAAQYYERDQLINSEEKKFQYVGKDFAHSAAARQTTGKALYTDDMPCSREELHAALVLSSQAHAKVLNIDLSAARKVEGFVDFISSSDQKEPGQAVGEVYKDELVFYDKIVYHFSQVIGLIVADSRAAAVEAVRLVKVQYEPLPAIISIEEAIEAKSFLDPENGMVISNTNSEKLNKIFADSQSNCVVEGQFGVGGQEHFYLETNCCIVTPTETGFEVLSSTQNVTKTQEIIAHVLHIPMNRVVSKNVRLGGGFGGKETRSLFYCAAVAVAADKLKRPVRLVLERDVDMCNSGQRHAFWAKYKAAASKDGKLQALDIEIYANAGFSEDLSTSILSRATLHIDSCYKWPNLAVKGFLCKTNQPSHTAFRGFGAPQGQLIGEQVIDHLARALNIENEKLRRANLYLQGMATHYGQKLEKWTIPEQWQRIVKSSKYDARLHEINAYNAQSRYLKRGIAICPAKLGLSFTAKFLNQAGALVNIYLDGSVLISHGGVEMGQGLNIKIMQIAAQELQCDINNVHITETATDKVPNTSPSAASVTSDMNGAAVLAACRLLNERLEAVRKELGPNTSFAQLAARAHFNRVSLSATGYYATPDCGFDWRTQTGGFPYYTSGVAVSEVELDSLTGQFKLLRTDIVMDVGTPINPAIDIGQIEGAFVQVTTS
jgi:xanthine dehydrogenase/oxidase